MLARLTHHHGLTTGVERASTPTSRSLQPKEIADFWARVPMKRDIDSRVIGSYRSVVE